MSLLIDSYVWTDGVTEADKVLNESFRNLDARVNASESNSTVELFLPGVLAVGFPIRFLWPFDSKNISAALAVNTAPVGAASLDIDLIVNDVPIFQFPDGPRILSGQKFGPFKSALLVTDFFAGDAVAVGIDQVGNVTPGSDLSIMIRSEKKP